MTPRQHYDVYSDKWETLTFKVTLLLIMRQKLIVPYTCTFSGFKFYYTVLVTYLQGDNFCDFPHLYDKPNRHTDFHHEVCLVV